MSPPAGATIPRPPRDPTPAERIVRPFQDFLRIEASAGILLLAATVGARPTGIWYCRVAAFNDACPAEGPW